ncbi:hypothetical protein P691DRAFT_763569 [Macrolepiota fuliginosa MF-IS2]|uniref:Uncharacterized protein n=1 Tax=Macrolepiota fuliginosa MF-IS2 TaxID=1400762 RepID=A0A9P5X6V2_9AGAR|nr:hypothetical protein P691DRAFT_763569 [Macrolepiota fuliginosa MF-IS2]
MLRIWALYRRNVLIISIAFFFYIGGVITLVGLTIEDYVKEKVIIDQTLGSLPGCYAKTVPEVIAGFWLAPLIVESIFFILVISRAFFWWREGHSVNGILRILTRDSSLYYAVIFALLFSSYCVFQWGPPFLSSLLVTPSITAGCILGSHLLLNLRSIKATDDGLQTTTGNVSLPLKIRRPPGASTFNDDTIGNGSGGYDGESGGKDIGRLGGAVVGVVRGMHTPESYTVNDVHGA